MFSFHEVSLFSMLLTTPAPEEWLFCVQTEPNEIEYSIFYSDGSSKNSNTAPESLDNFIGIIHEVGFRRLDRRNERS